MERHHAQQATAEEKAVIIKCESFVRHGDSYTVDTCFEAYHSILTSHGHNLGEASVIASAHPHRLSRGVQVPRPGLSSAQRLHQRELLPAHRSGANSELSRVFSQRGLR